MPNQLGQAGAQSQTPTKFAPLYTGRFSSGLWTNRSPLRDATTTRVSEKFYGAAGDALIAGTNVEITNKLTLARRPGNSRMDSNSFSSVDRFYEFRQFSSTSEQISLMVDQADALYSLYAGVKTLLWTKQPGAEQSYMQSVGNTLYWGDGVSNKKWLQTLNTWNPNVFWNGPLTPFQKTFIIDNNGNIQQLTGTVFAVSSSQVTDGVLTITVSGLDLTTIISEGCVIRLPPTMKAAALGGLVVTVTGVSVSTVDGVLVGAFTADVTAADSPLTDESVSPLIATLPTGGRTLFTGHVPPRWSYQLNIASEIAGLATPQSGAVYPSWNKRIPASTNQYQGGDTVDGTAVWTNRGKPVQNWGIANGTKPLKFSPPQSLVAWHEKTFYSLIGAIIDPNGNLQQVTTPGVSGGSIPTTWGTSVGDVTTDGAVKWKMIQTASSLTWQSHHSYTPSVSVALKSVAVTNSGTTVYSGIVTGGDANAFAGQTFVISRFGHSENNGTFRCTASTASTLTLQNGSGIAEETGGVAITVGQFIVATASGTSSLFQLAPLAQPFLEGNVSAYLYEGPGSSLYTGRNPSKVGDFTLTYPLSTGAAVESATSLTSLSFRGSPLDEGASLEWDTLNASAEKTGSTTPFTHTKDYLLTIHANISIPVAGQYSFSLTHKNGMLWGIGNNASLVSGHTSNEDGQTVTAVKGYPLLGGTNSLADGSYPVTDKYVVDFPNAGVYPVEIDYAYWYHSGQVFNLTCNGKALAHGTPQTGSTAPVWCSWSTNFAPEYPSVNELNDQLTWQNLGPISDYSWAADTTFTLPGSTIIDPNGNSEFPYRSGTTGTDAPVFLTGLNQLTVDVNNLIWINEGSTTTTPTGTVSTFNGGWRYCVALVNTLDNTVSNCTPLSAATGDFIGVRGVTLPPGAGLPDKIDPQADYVAIFRTTDGQAVPFLIPGKYSTFTLSLWDYMEHGYVDATPDDELNNLISGAIAGENSVPENGAKNLAFHVNRLWYSVANIVKWTAGADTPVGNGVSGTPPFNFVTLPSLVKRIVPTATGVLVFTVSDVYVIQGQGTRSSPIQPPLPVMEGVGILSYNALAVNGSVIGFFTTDNQFCVIDPSAGVSYAGFPIGDQLRLNNGRPGQSWNPANVYVTWYVNGEDQGWFLADGQNGWFRLTLTPTPEAGYTWSTFATIAGGCKALQSIEISPGVHRLLLGPVGEGPVLMRDLSTYQDNGHSYSASAVVGSAVLAQPGQVAVVSFITTESVRVGSPTAIAVLLDDALPYYKGPFDLLRQWEPDPPGLKPSRSIYAQRFYMSELKDEAVCRHMQVQIVWVPENAANELLSLTIFGAFLQEQ